MASTRKTNFTSKQIKSYGFQSFQDYRDESRGTQFNLESRAINIGFGTRYVFFSSLYNQKQPIYAQLAAQGQQLVSSAAAALGASQQGNNNQQDLAKIQSYIQMIGQAASNELSLQHNFLSKLIAKTKDKALKKFIEQNKDLIDPSNRKFDYTTFIIVLNKFSTQIDDFTKKRRKILLDNARLIENNINDQKQRAENLRDQLKEAMNQGYSQFQRKLREQDLLKTRNQGQIDEQKFNGGLHNIIAQKVTAILNQISKDSTIVATLETDIINLFNGASISNDKIAMQITAAIIDYLLHDVKDIESQTNESLKNSFLQFRKTHKRIYTDKEIESISNAIVKKVIRPIEQQALITQKNVGQLFSELSGTAQSDIIKEYSNYGLDINKVNNLLTKLKASTNKAKTVAGLRGELTKILRQAIFKKYQGFQNLTLKERKEKLDQLIQQGQMTFSSTELRQSIENALRIKVQGSALSENIQAQLMSKVKSLLVQNGLAKVMGTKIKMKTDIAITYKLGELKGIKSTKAKKLIEEKLGSFTDNFVTRYSNETNNQIKIDVAKEVYLDQQKKIIDAIREQAERQGLDPTEAIESLENFFFTEVSQKEYIKGGNFGFEGGSLGSGGAPQGVIDNITKMYETGGISPVDKELLYFAAINCSNAALGASLKVPLQHYLLGGAALMMFDSGFTATTNFLEQMKSYLGIDKAQGSLHLFSLQGGNLIPASYLYSSIYNALVSAYQGIISVVNQPLYETAISQGNAGNRVTITNNLTDEDIPHFSIVPNAEQRWDYISGIAASSVNISFTFLGGMLDIFEAIANAFNI